MSTDKRSRSESEEQDQQKKQKTAEKILLVTGANRGIGAAICSTLLKQHPEVRILAAVRSVNSAQSLVEASLAYKDRLQIIELDVTKEDVCKDAAQKIVAQYGMKCLHGVINNAGVAVDPPWWKELPSSTAARTTLEVNFLGVKRVCEHFLPLLKTSTTESTEKGRIVNVSSGVAGMDIPHYADDLREQFKSGTLTPQQLTEHSEKFIEVWEKALTENRKDNKLEWPRQVCGYWMRAYGFSKVLLNCYTEWLSAKENGLIVNVCSPGFVDTEMTASYSEGEWQKRGVEKGAETPCWLATSDDPKATQTGKYFRDCEVQELPR